MNLEINSVLERSALQGSDKGFYTALVYTAVEKQMLLDYILEPLLKKPISRLDTEVRAALRLGAVQIFFFDRIPDHSACDETVDVIKASAVKSAAGLVNAVLRNLCRGKAEHEKRIEDAPIHIKYSMPQWIVELWQECYGEEKTLSILEAFSKKASLFIHTNTLKITSEALCSALEERGYSTSPHPLIPDILKVEEVGDAKELYGFHEGLFFVQGTASALAVKALSPTPGSCVFDLCACPGGKSFAAAISLENRGKIYSSDIHKNKLSLIEKGAERLGISIIETASLDARESFGEYEGLADFVIADVPCSGLGVISKKPDIKTKCPQDIARLPEIQYDILENGARLLKRSGRLLYSTCTLNRAENEHVTERFLENHQGFHREDGFPKTYFPGDQTEDGFFVDILIKD